MLERSVVVSARKRPPAPDALGPVTLEDARQARGPRQLSRNLVARTGSHFYGDTKRARARTTPLIRSRRLASLYVFLKGLLPS